MLASISDLTFTKELTSMTLQLLKKTAGKYFTSTSILDFFLLNMLHNYVDNPIFCQEQGSTKVQRS